MTLTRWQIRYSATHQAYQRKITPAAVKDHGYVPTQFPKVLTANGLTKAIVNYINWDGGNATRINTTGRLIDGKQKQASGVVLGVKKWIPGTTRRGTADITATIHGRSCKFEIKVGRDQPRPEQLAEQVRERSAGGVYEFISDMDEFFGVYDRL